jgi:hypothetical protein
MNQNQSIMFIMFPGHGDSYNDWDYDFQYPHQSNFIQSLKELGTVYTFTLPWNNVLYYKNSNRSKLFSNDLDFTFNDLNVINYCRKLYHKISTFNGKFVLIGHSIGCIFAYHFGQLYYYKCLFSILLEPTFYKDYQIPIQNNNNLYSDIEIQKLKQIIMKSKNKDTIDTAIIKILEISAICIMKYCDQSYINSKIKQIVFHDVSRKKENIEIKNKNIADKYEYILLKNQKHYPHYNTNSRNIIIDKIKTQLAIL